jgi:preprotein translocase subunit SecE
MFYTAQKQRRNNSMLFVFNRINYVKLTSMIIEKVLWPFSNRLHINNRIENPDDVCNK